MGGFEGRILAVISVAFDCHGVVMLVCLSSRLLCTGWAGRADVTILAVINGGLAVFLFDYEWASV